MPDYDAIIVGAGHNGLAAAATLARQGLSVLVLEARGEVGGMAATRELFPGFRHNVGAWAFMVFSPHLMKELELSQNGLQLIEPDTSFCNFGVPGEQPFVLYNDFARLLLHLGQDHGEAALAGLLGVFDFCRPFVDTWNRIRYQPPTSVGAMLEAARTPAEQDLLRKVLHASAMDVVREFFPDPEQHRLIQVMLAGMATDGTGLGPYDPGTALSLVYHLVPAGIGQFYKLARGGMGMVSEALRKALEDRGGELRLKTPVRRVLVQRGRVSGVELGSGETISARAVLSSLDAQATFLRLVGPEQLPGDFVGRVKNIKFGTPYIQIQLTLDELPQFEGDLAFANQDRINWFMSYSQGPEHLQQCVDACKWGGIPDDPMWAYYIPSVWDPSLAPAGQHTATIFSFYFPMAVPAGKHKELRDRLTDRLIDSVDRFAPNFRRSITNQAVFTWKTFEAMYGITAGDYAHGLLIPGQMFDYRPAVGCADYRTPVQGLYLCGAGCHPGPGVTAVPGTNGARQVLADLGAGPQVEKDRGLLGLREWGRRALSRL